MPRKRKTESQQARQFALTLPVVLALMAALTLWRGHSRVAIGLVSAIPVVLVLGFALPAAWLRFFRLWMLLGHGMSWVMTRLLLGVFFFLVFTPFGLAMRLLGKRPLDLAWRDGKPSYWVDKTPGEYTVERYERQF